MKIASSVKPKPSVVVFVADVRRVTSFYREMASMTVLVDDEGYSVMEVDGLQLVVPGIGTITGTGTISPNNALNFKMIAKLSQAGAGGTLGALTGLTRIGAAQNGIPFLIQGTTSLPVFIPDVGGIVAGGLAGQLGQAAGQKNANPAQQGLGGILGNILKKKP